MNLLFDFLAVSFWKIHSYFWSLLYFCYHWKYFVWFYLLVYFFSTDLIVSLEIWGVSLGSSLSVSSLFGVWGMQRWLIYPWWFFCIFILPDLPACYLYWYCSVRSFIFLDYKRGMSPPVGSIIFKDFDDSFKSLVIVGDAFMLPLFEIKIFLTGKIHWHNWILLYFKIKHNALDLFWEL